MEHCDQRPALSVIVGVHDCWPLTQEMFDSLSRTVPMDRVEVIVIDDASGPETADKIAQLQPPFFPLRNEINRGFSRANNRGARSARARNLAFLNNDLVLTNGWLEPMLELLESRPNVGAVGNVQLRCETGDIDHAGIYFDLEGMPTHALKTRRRIPSAPYAERSAVTAACMLIQADRFWEAGGFDERYQNGMEDVALCAQLHRLGYRHYVSHRSIIRHHVSSSPGRHRRNYDNSELFRHDWAPYMKELGKREWPREYLRRYARYWWRMEPRKFLKALFLLAMRGAE